jgi:hypothetical protein
MKQMKLSLKTNYSKMELFYFKQQTKTPSPSKLATGVVQAWVGHKVTFLTLP